MTLISGLCLVFCYACFPPGVSNLQGREVKVRLASELAWESRRFTGNQYALLTNSSSQQLFNLADSLVRLEKVSVFFSPEHGFSTNLPDGVHSGDEYYRNRPVVSLYGARKKPLTSDFGTADTLLIDIQDVGLRWYTYLSTIRYCLETAAEAGIPVVILDRPNPLGGDIAEGPIPDSSLMSFVGALPIPVRYGLTVGELFSMAVGEKWFPGMKDLKLTVIRFTGWNRKDRWPETGLKWIPPSPNLPDYVSLVWYNGTCLFEGTNVSEGRGTSVPFQWIGAPWLTSQDSALFLQAGFRVRYEKRTPVTLSGKAVRPKYENEQVPGFFLESSISSQSVLSGIRQVLQSLQSTGHPLSIKPYFYQLLGSRSIAVTDQEKAALKDFQKKSSGYYLYR